MKKIISFLSILGFIGGLIAFSPAAMAAVAITTATGGGAISADTTSGTWTSLGNIVITSVVSGDFTINQAGATIILTAPTGFEFNPGSVPNVVATNNLGTASTAVTNATTITVTYTSGATANVADSLTIGSVTLIQVRPTAKTLPAGNITRTGGTSTIAGLANDAVVGTLTEVPGPTTTLSCISSGSGGAVWLRWTNPGGDPKTAYTVRYSLANITAGNYDTTATAFTQTWPVATEGNISQQLVNALTPNNVYFFAMKSNSGNGLSTISNTVFCTAPTSYAGGTPDAKAPTSTITAPTAGQGIKAGESYTITGTSVDTGGSSVKQVEISLDGGTTWYSIVAITSTTAGLDWNYVWSNPALGSYTIKTRATDWVGNVETPGAGVSVTVLTTVPAFTAEISGPSTTAITATTIVAPALSGLPYVAPVGVTQITANITYLQQQLVVLLQQLLASLLAQVQH